MTYKVSYEDLLELLGADKDKDIEDIRINYKDRFVMFVIKDKAKWRTT